MEPWPKSSGSTSTWISEDLWAEILARLPVKSLCRFRCVCNRWNSVITSPFLVNLQHWVTCSSTTPRHLRVKPYLRVPYVRVEWLRYYSHYALYYPPSLDVRVDPIRGIHFPFQFGDSSFHFRFVSVVRGVVCLSATLDSTFDLTLLWNPAIHKYIRLPRRPLPSHLQAAIADFAHVVGFAETVRFHCHAIGFYYDTRNTDFKVVRLWVPPSDLFRAWQPLCEVYSVREGLWREVPFTHSILQPWVLDITKSRTGFFFNGTMHWIATTPGHCGDFVLMFECERQEFTTMELPDAMLPRYHVFTQIDLLECNGMLSTMVQPRWENDWAFDFWVMPEYGSVSSWTKLYRVLARADNLYHPSWSLEKLAPYEPWVDILQIRREQLLNDLVYDESLSLMDDPKSQSYAKDEIIYILI